MRSIKLKSFHLYILVAVFIMLTGNIALFKQVFGIYPVSENLGFIISLFLLSVTVLIFVFSLLGFFLPARPLLIFFIVVAAVTSYFSDKFGTIINTEMIRNTLETDIAEASDLLSWSLLIRIFLLGIVPAIVIYLLPYQTTTWKKNALYSSGISIASFAVIALLILSNGNQFASFFRQHKSVRYYSNPIYPIYSSIGYISDQLKAEPDTTLVGLNMNESISEADTHAELIIMVVGETARADHFSLNGYIRETNPFTKEKERLISYSNISSCGTSTSISVPCMFSFYDRGAFEVNDAKYTENILDVLKGAGINVLWRDNNSDSKGVATRVEYQSYKSPDVNPECDIECRDVGMLNGLQDYIDAHQGDIFIVLHQMGSHGPAYYKRYPKDFEHFTPACQSAELSECTQDEIINAYDNSIRYTDYFLSKVIELLENNTAVHETAMFYLSDHGESLGENGIYLHGMPYLIAPDAQKKVPVLLWSSESSDVDYLESVSFKDTPNSQDVVFNTLLTLFEVATSKPLSDEGSLITIRDENEPH